MEITNRDGRTHIRIDNVEGDLTVEPSPRGPVLIFEQEGLRVSFCVSTHSAIKLVDALERALAARGISKR